MTSISHSKTGIILVVRNFEECVAFYRDLFGLSVMHEKVQGDFRLTCLEFGTSYLMIETEPPFPQTAHEKNVDQNPTKLRFNVPDIEAALKIVRAFGVDAQIDEFDWGSTINLTDPDGNRVGIRDERGFDSDSAPSSAAQPARDAG
ncbi:MAG: VOC family protein [Pirellulaceae bacterium]